MKKVLIGMLILMATTAVSNAEVFIGVTATASRVNTSTPPRGNAENAVNSNGFTATDPNGWFGTHSQLPYSGGYAHWYYDTNTGDVPGTDGWIEFELGSAVKKLTRIKVWNLNWDNILPDYVNGGVRDMEIVVTDRNGTPTTLVNPANGGTTWYLNKATGLASYDASNPTTTFPYPVNNVLDIPDVLEAKTVRFNIIYNWGSTKRCGLSEVRFEGEYETFFSFVDAGNNQTVTSTAATTVVNLDGFAVNAPQTTWTVDSSPAGSTVIFGNVDAVDTTATVDYPGTYVLRLSDDVNTTISDTVTIQVNKVVTVGADQVVDLNAGPVTVNLSGTCTTAVTWTVDSGPDTVTFVPNADSLTPSVTLDTRGTYVFRMTDDLFGLYDTVKVTVMQAPLPAGLVGYWPLNGNANDSTAYAHHGITHGAPQYVDGKVGKGIKFDGLHDGIEIPDETFFESSSPEMTVTFWAKVPYGEHPEGTVVAKKDFTLDTNAGTFPPENKGIGWGLDSAAAWRDGFIIWLTYTPTGGRLSVGYNDSDFTYDTHYDGKWRHYAAVTSKNPTNENYHVDYYIDGVLKGTAYGITITNLLNDTPLAFGMSASYPGARNWAGYLDEVRYYNYALTAQQVLDLIAADGDTCATKAASDINGDCEVNLKDFAQLASDWLLDCTYPNCQ